ncbi:hypothetical protein HELRODRAFT_172590 [Helobdella robusta]|uniref:Endonuclease/exonuclease/phosphatase domain-containing protein n=1 Tax=Helobdella robusta TaxID=6412 RepID=T1F5K4_HELRO|nr:hypothetical protein HELRODRAFT_172590 [Helobdella robusta]ESO04234.1 hypothetical protein HELRODRAFT_172590 [Helobdella robusta]
MVRIGLLNVTSINNKVDDVYGMIYDGLDILILCETWHGTEGNISVRLAMPPGFTFVDFVRPHDPGHGGLVIYFRSDFKYKKINFPLFSKFEALAISLKIGIDQFCLIALYRPGSKQTTSLFFEELISMLEFITMSEAHVVLMGDFDIHVEKRDSPFTLRLHEILDMFQLVNHVNQQAHVSRDTLDLVICSQDFPILDTKIDPCLVYSDHSYVSVRVALNQVRPKLVKACVKPWKDLNEKYFVEALANSPVANKCQSDDVDNEFALFSGKIQRISDNLVPMRALNSQGVLGIPGKYAIAEGCCRKIQNGPSLVLRLETLNVGSLAGCSMEIAEMLERRRKDICYFQETRWKLNGVCNINSDNKKYKLSGMVKRRPKMVLEFLSKNR